ncbi:MAG: copper chaperone PCu(A)C [Gammaproteobacteria bacterium]|nr:copper chaperone PCu(A)C [Gammaproteobacteria bacterium]
MKHTITLIVMTGFALFHAVLATAAENTFSVHNAWVREAPPNAQVLAGYAQIENASSQADAIVAVSSDAFEKAEIHHSEVKDGVARMTQIKSLDLPPHQIVKLEPGGAHFMLFKPKSPLRAGQPVQLNFTLSSGKTFSTHAEVRNAVQSSEHHH